MPLVQGVCAPSSPPSRATRCARSRALQPLAEAQHRRPPNRSRPMSKPAPAGVTVNAEAWKRAVEAYSREVEAVPNEGALDLFLRAYLSALSAIPAPDAAPKVFCAMLSTGVCDQI